ncbi:hypothetical protein S40285_10894 [Stachybotrys chlorohalonatus IBT 40285]|uniref:Myb/SANT-like domain-containing protein n=1 Tax=Stachybotrys chlorohalonatus (strain IBT 40285) TaxID=1283841 RepID=A0A084Q877_STAC4|nr:hypothetical protein S40285_10894 [Stachybotrys chlorohalonata IBT 40285]
MPSREPSCDDALTQSGSGEDVAAGGGSNSNATAAAAAAAVANDPFDCSDVEGEITVANDVMSSLPSVDWIQPKRQAEKKDQDRLHWQQVHTLTFLEFLREYRNQGRLYNDKSTLVRKLMDEILPLMQDKFPEWPWTAKKLFNHWKTLRSKHRQFLWWEDKTGTSYNNDTGIIIASPEQWKAFDKRFGRHGVWLKARGLPQADLYDEVFLGNEALGKSMVDATIINSSRDADDIPGDSNMPIDIDGDGYNNSLPLDSQIPESQSVLSPAPASSPRFPRKRAVSSSVLPTMKRRRVTDSSSSNSRIIEELQTYNVNSSLRRQAQQQARPVDIPGAHRVVAAIADCRQTFGLQG